MGGKKKKEAADKPLIEEDFEPEHPPHVLKEKIRMLEEELVRKEEALEQLRKDNDLLFKTAMKNSEERVDQLRAEKE